jgi:hypothetical protein
MKVPTPRDQCYYIQEQYSYGWDIVVCDFNCLDCKDREIAMNHLRRMQTTRPEKTYRLILAEIRVTYLVIE